MSDIELKFEKDVFKNLDKKNLNKIICFLLRENCNYIEDILSDYLDLFMIDYKQFVIKYNLLNEKYNNCFIKEASENMQLLEEFYNV